MDLQRLREFEGKSVGGDYHLRTLIGTGGFGVVFRADHIVDGIHIREVAVKLTLPAEEDPERQFGDLIAWASLKHDHVLQCLHAGSTDLAGGRVLFQVMELADYSLSVKLKEGALPDDVLLDLIEQVFTALAWLHDEKKCVHRDIKPGNILRAEGRWKLADFGTLRVSASGGTSQTDMVVGSRPYMPPEANYGLVSPGWDVWSVGVLILEAASGKRPEPEHIIAIQHNEPGTLPDLPEPYQEIVLGCLTADHKSRWPARRALEILRSHRAVLQERERVRCLEQMQELKAQVRRELGAGRWREARSALEEAEIVNGSDLDLHRLATEIRRCQEEEEDLQRRVVSAVMAGNYVLADQLLRARVHPIIEPLLVPPAPRTLVWRKRWLPVGLVAVAVGLAALLWQTGFFTRSTGESGPSSGGFTAPPPSGQPGSDGSPIVLQNGVPEQRTSSTPVHYRVAIPPLTSTFSVVLTPISNEADLDLYYAAMPAPGVSGKPDCQRSHTGLNEERCIIYSPPPGNWYIGVKPDERTGATVRILASYESKAIPLQNDVPVRLSSPSSVDYRITVPPAAGELRVALTPNEATFDLSHWDGQQSLVKEETVCSRADSRSLVCKVSNPRAGEFFIHVNPTGDKSTMATLQARYQ